ncbi:hypothetical protein [Prochlorococcus sp. MIT 1307]|uniref:hypothetical protein n=1 Tax=Prochlorococcus sp. MIT 1307 TaxID=3096219 RepID=UPI002A761EF7|nr:hypothetical protein [Prochlorococcus sp. MIT 1307]
MTTLILVVNPMGDDRPSRSDPLEDSLSSAQFRRFQKILIEDSKDDYGYSD